MVNHLTKTILISKTRLPPKENPTPNYLVRYTSYDPTQGDLTKAYASDLPFLDILDILKYRRYDKPILLMRVATTLAAPSWSSITSSSSASLPSDTF